MVTVVLHGNCQGPVIGSFLELMCPSLTVLPTEALTRGQVADPEAIRSRLRQADIVVMQPVGETYGMLSSVALRADFPGKTFLTYPSVYFAGTAPHLAQLILDGDDRLFGPLGTWHDMRILDSFLASDDEAATLDRIARGRDRLGTATDACIAETAARDRDVDLPVLEEVRALLPAGPVFHTPNHPVNLLLWRLAQRMLDMLGLSHRTDPAAVMPQEQRLGQIRCAVPVQVARHLDLPWRLPRNSMKGEEIPWQRLVRRFRNLYASRDDLDAICRNNPGRARIPVGARSAALFGPPAAPVTASPDPRPQQRRES